MFRFFAILTLTISSFLSSYSQEGSIKAISHYSDGVLYLRWGVDNYKTYDSIRHFGIKIERETIINDGDTLSPQNQIASKIILLDTLKPKSDEWLESNLPQNDFTNLLRASLYSNQGDSLINFVNPRLVDAINRDKQNQAKLFAIQYAAEQDFSIAMAAALGGIDQNTEPNSKYRYTFILKDSLGNFITQPVILTASTFTSEVFAPIVKPIAKGLPSAIEIKWIKTPETRYVGYDIYRSENDINYVKLNDKPFVYFKSSTIISNEITYIDSVPPGEEYYYKIVGRTPFGTFTSYSDTTWAKALFPRLNDLVISIDKPIPSLTEVPLVWSMDLSFNDKVQGFNIYRSDQFDGTFTKVNGSYIAPGIRTFTDENPNSVGYYYVEAIDNHNYNYSTPPTVVYLPDSIPPAIPSGLTAKYFGITKVELDWTQNSETDLAGYRVEVSNYRNGVFVQSTPAYIITNKYTYNSDPNVVSDSIFFRIFAQDKRGNYSEKSQPVGCKRPDIVPPAAPGFSKAMPTRKGIELKWDYSPTSTVIMHRLERKAEGTPNWTTVVMISNEQKVLYMPTDSTDYNFLDTTLLEARTYQYRFIAEEDFDITATSSMLSVNPLPVLINKSLILNFKIEEEIVVGRPSQLVQDQINNLKRVNPGARYSSAANEQHNIKLTFTYKLDPTVQEFQIFRSITGGNMIVYRTVTITEALGLDPLTQQVNVQSDMGLTDFIIMDKDVLTGRRYTYQVIARHKDGSTSPRSMTLTKKINQN
jgi:uncharacterized protein